MRQITRINQSGDMPSMADAIGRETNSGGHIVYLDKWLTRITKPLRLRAIMQALGLNSARRDAAVLGFVAWKSDAKAKGVTAGVSAVVVAAVTATVASLATGHPGDRHEPLQHPALSSSATPSQSPTRAPRAVQTPARVTTAAPRAAEATPSSVMSYSYVPAEPVAETVQPNPAPNAPSSPAPGVPSTRPAQQSGGAPRAAKSGVCVNLYPVVKLCLS